MSVQAFVRLPAARNGTIVITREQAVAYIATGLLPEEALLAALPEHALAAYQRDAGQPWDRWRRNLGPVRVAEFRGGEQAFGWDVELDPPHWLRDGKAHVTAAGTGMSLDGSDAFAEAVAVANAIARDAEKTAAGNPAEKEQSR